MQLQYNSATPELVTCSTVVSHVDIAPSHPLIADHVTYSQSHHLDHYCIDRYCIVLVRTLKHVSPVKCVITITYCPLTPGYCTAVGYDHE